MCESIHILVILKYRLVYIYISNTIILYSNSNNGEKKSDDTRFSTVISRSIIHLKVRPSNQFVAPDNDPLLLIIYENSGHRRGLNSARRKTRPLTLRFIRSRTRARINFSSKEKPGSANTTSVGQTSRRRLVASIHPSYLAR